MSHQCQTKFKMKLKKMHLQMKSLDWKWRECLLAVSSTYHQPISSHSQRYLENICCFFFFVGLLLKILYPHVRCNLNIRQKFQLLLFQDLAVLARTMTTAKPGGVGNGITTVISDALRGSYFFVSGPADEQAERENSRTAVQVNVADATMDEGRLKKVKRRKRKKRGRTKRHRSPLPENLGRINADPIWRDDSVPVVVWDPLQMSHEDSPPRGPRSVAVVDVDGQREGPAAAASQLLIAVEETSSSEAPPPRVPRLIDDAADVEVSPNEKKEEKSPSLLPTRPPVLVLSSDEGARPIYESDRLFNPSNNTLPTSVGGETDQSEAGASLQAESPPTVEVAATIEIASEPGSNEEPEVTSPLPDDAGSTKLPGNEEGEPQLEVRKGTAVPPDLPSHLKVLNFKFKEGTADDAINANLVENDDEEAKVLVVLPAEAGSSSSKKEGARDSDSERPPLVLLASTVAPPTTTTTTTTTTSEAPTLPASPVSAPVPAGFTLPTSSAALLDLTTQTGTPGSNATSTTLDPIRTGMKIIQSSTLFVPSPNPGKTDYS